MTATSFRPWISMLMIAAGTAVGCGDNKSVATPDSGTGDQPDAREPGDPAVGKWGAGFNLPGPSGFGARVEDVAIAADGRVVVAGIFADVAGVPANNVAMWNGSDWVPLADGREGWVRAAAFDVRDTLWVASNSLGLDDGVLARWDGTAWTQAPALDGPIRDFAFVSSGVAVVGDFTGGVRIYNPDTNTWEAPAPSGINGFASAIAASPTGFCIAGSFTSINGVSADNAACWNGTAWSRLGTNLPGGVSVLARSPAGTWYAGGTLTFIVDPLTGAYEAGIAVLNGSTWQPFQGGIDNGFINEVRTIAFVGTDVLVGGHFQTAGTNNTPARHLARYSPTGGGWSQLGGGLVNDVGVFLPSLIGTGDIAIASDGSIWVGGIYTRAGSTPAVNLARIGTDGIPRPVVGPRSLLGVGGVVNAVAADRSGNLIVGGAFGFGGLTPLNNLGALKGTAWTELGGGITGIVRDVLARKNGTIAVAGELYIANHQVAVVEWNGSAWSEPGGRVEGVGFTLAEDLAGNLWVGGDLASVNGNPATGAARILDGAWTPAGTFDGRVHALAAQGDTMIAAGSFSTIDAQPARGVAIFRGTSWTQLGALDGDYPSASALAVSPTLGVVVGGDFAGVDGVTAVDLARWDGTAWHALGAGFEVDTYSFVSELEPYGDGLFIAGGFDGVAATSAKNLAWYDGSKWHALGAGLADLAESMVVVDDVLYVGGPFTVVNGVPSSGLATWDFRR